MHRSILQEYGELNHDFKLGHEFHAYSGCLIDPLNFYVLPTKYKTFIEKYLRRDRRLEENELEPGTTVIYMSKERLTYIRGLIKDLRENRQCGIVSVDYGYFEPDIEFEDIYYPANRGIKDIPSLALHCELERCLPIMREFTEDTIIAFNTFVGRKALRVRTCAKQGNKLVVRITNFTAAYDVASLLSMTQLTTVEIPPRRTSQLKYEWKYKKVEVGQILDVAVQHGYSETDFYVIAPTDYQEYVRDRAHFSSYCRALPYIATNDNILGKAVGVMAFHGGPYERGVVTEVPPFGNKIRVKLIDWGKEYSTELSKVRLISSAFLARIPARAIYCSDPMVRMWDRQNFLRRGYEIKIKIKHLGSKHDVPNVVSIALKTSKDSNLFNF